MKTRKKTILFFIAFVCLTNLFAQSNNWLWAKNNGGTVYDQDHSVSVDTLGNVFAAGNFSSISAYFGPDTLLNTNVAGTSSDVVIAKYDTNGNVLWAKSGGGANEDVAYSVSVDPNGDAFIAGYFQSPSFVLESTTLTNSGSNDVLVAKYDTNGNLLWAKSAGGANDDQGISVSADAAGNVFVTGCFQSPTITFGSITLTNVDPSGNTYDIFLVKYDANGNVLWAKSAGGTDWDWSYSVAADAFGNVFITGYFENPSISFGSLTLTSAGLQDIFLAKYDTNGNLVWAKHASTTYGGNRSHCVTTDRVGNVIITGEFGGPSITFGSITLPNPNGNYAAFIVKYDTNGNVLWAKGAAGQENNAGESVSADAAGNVFSIGLFESSAITFGALTLTNPNSTFPYDAMYLVEFDANGNALCAKSLSGAGCDYSAICSDPFGNAFIGTTYGTIPFVVGSDTLNAANGTFFVAKYNCLCTPFLTIAGDQSICKGETTTLSASGASSYVWLPGPISNDSITVSPLATTTYSVIATSPNGCSDTTAITVNVSLCTGIVSVENGSERVEVFPNPSNGKFTFVVDHAAHSRIYIYNSLGELVDDSFIEISPFEIDLTDTGSGVYFFRIISQDENHYSGKIIIQE